MALKSTIFKAQLQIADMDRGVYADHALTLALHPSETEERLMVRLGVSQEQSKAIVAAEEARRAVVMSLFEKARRYTDQTQAAPLWTAAVNEVTQVSELKDHGT